MFTAQNSVCVLSRRSAVDANGAGARGWAGE